MSTSFRSKVGKYSEIDTPDIAMGLASPDEEIIDSLEEAKEYADIVLIGPPSIKKIGDTFEVVTDENPEKTLAKYLAQDKVDGIVHGTVDDLKTYETYKELTGESYSIVPGLLEDPKGRQFFLSPLSNREGWSKEERYRIASNLAKFVSEWDIAPDIAIFTGVRHVTYDRKGNESEGVSGVLNETYKDAEWIVNKLNDEGYNAKNWSIDLNPAVESGCNVLVPVNGMVGNQIFRTVLFCGGDVLAVPRLGLSRPYEDNSRTERDFEFHVKWLAALINKRSSSV